MMESCSGIVNREEELMELPPGFRFHPTDEELISHYLTPKVVNNRFSAVAIGEVDLNKCEPWDLPRRARMGEKEWYFFFQRDRKYPTGLRTNRATEAGYWKATGKDKEIMKAKALVGMKKTLVFYKGRAPKGEKSDWVMHEYRLEGKYSLYNLSKTTKNEWVICRVFKKSVGGKKTHISGLMTVGSYNGDEFRASLLPPLTDSPPYEPVGGGKTSSSHVTCFSDAVEDRKGHGDVIFPIFNDGDNDNNNNYVNSLSFQLPRMGSLSFYSNQVPQSFGSLSFNDAVALSQQQSVMSMLMADQPGMKRCSKAEFSDDMAQRSFEDQNDPSSSVGPVDLGCLWNY